MQVSDCLPIRPQEQINPEKPGDYQGEDGLLYCGVCGKAKQYHIHSEILDAVVPCICDCRKVELELKRNREDYEEKMRRIERLRTNSMMSAKYKDASFESYKRRPENEEAYRLATAYCDNWDGLKRSGQGILFYGPVGTGKSYTAACIANELLSRQVPVVMTSFAEILKGIRGTAGEEPYTAAFNSAGLLIIDDLGAERDTGYAQEKVYSIIDSRIQSMKPMILTTNLDLGYMLTCDDLRYKRTYDRILEVCYPVEVSGPSMRMAEASRRFESVKDLIAGAEQ